MTPQGPPDTGPSVRSRAMLFDTRLPERFWAKVSPEPNTGCWLWTGNISPNGYGRFWLDGRKVGAHRVAYEALVSPIPSGLDADHLCRVRSCCNPAHIEPVTRAENTRRGDAPQILRERMSGPEGARAIKAAAEARRAQTHCPNGHEYTPENTYWQGSGRWRRCRACNREWMRRKRISALHPRRMDGSGWAEVTP